MRRRRTAPPDPDVQARLQRVLGVPAAGGWVPAEVVEPPPERVAPPRREPAVEEPAPGQEASSWSPHRDPDDDRGLAALLPDTVRGGRLDPGRRAAVGLLLVALVAAAGAGAVAVRSRPQPVEAPAVTVPGEPLPGTGQETPGPAAEVVVSVAGHVVRPGLVRLPGGSRVDDAVRAAGGVVPGRDPGLLNLARRLVDGEQVLVGVAPPPGAAPPGAGAAAGGLVDLNAATADDLDQLPGIGPVLAERIVSWRTEHGGFRSVDQLREVPGIGESKYASLKAKVTV